MDTGEGETTPQRKQEHPMQSPKPELSCIKSPGAKRCLNFNYWSNDPQESSQVDKKRARIQSEEKEANLIKINELTKGQYWDKCVKGRVSLKKWFGVDDKGLPLGLNFNINDGTGEICVTAFGADARRMAEIVKINGCYEVRTFFVNEPNPKTINKTGSQFIIRANRRTEVKEIDSTFPDIMFDAITVDAAINEKGPQDTIDILGVVVDNSDLHQTDQGRVYRYFVLTDETKQCIRVTLWGEEAREFGDDKKFVVALKLALVENYDNYNCLNTYSYTTVWKNPENGRAKDLQAWFELADKEHQSQKKD